MKKLWRFNWDCGRQGTVEGLFVATVEEVAEAIGQQVYFGEILGKHSEIYGVLESSDVAEVEGTPEQIEWLVRTFNAKEPRYNHSSRSITIMGYNPLHYIGE